MAWDPKDADMHFGRGSCYYKLGSYQKSVNDFSEVIKMFPTEIISYLKRSLPYIELTKYADAKSDLRKYLHLGGKQEGAYYYLGWCYTYLADSDPSKSDSAIICLKFYIQGKNEANRNDPSSYMLLGMAFTKKRDSAAAYENFRKSISLNSSSSETYFQWGNSALIFRNFKKADELFSEARRRGKGVSVDLYNRYGLAKAGIGDTTSAIEYYSKALAIDNGLRKVYENRLALLLAPSIIII